MNPTRKIISAALAGALALGAASPALADNGRGRDHVKKDRFQAQFGDWDQNFWGNEALARMITKGVIKGSDGMVAARRSVSRLEAAIMLVRLLHLDAQVVQPGETELEAPWGEIKLEVKDDKFELKLKTHEGEIEFEDDDKVPSWGRDAVLIALQKGFLIFDGARLSPMASLNRLEAAMMLVKAAGLDEQAKAQADAQLTFADAGKIPARLRGYIAVAVEHGFVNGYEDGTFHPEKQVSRAEWAALLDRLDRQGPDVSPDGRQVKGTVTGVSVGTAPTLSMTTPVFPNGVTYPVDDTAAFYKDGKVITIADIAAGDNVIINLSADRKILLVSVHNVPHQVTGKVTTFTAPTATAAGSITVSTGSTTAADGTVTPVTTAYPVSAETKVTLSGQAATFADIRTGDDVDLTVEGGHLTTIAIKVTTSTVAGALTAVTPGANNALPVLTVTADGTAATYTVADYATFKDANGAAITLADLEAGDEVTLKIERNLVTAVKVTGVATLSVTGILDSITAATATAPAVLSVTVNGTAKNYTVAAGATIKDAAGVSISLSDLLAGDHLTLQTQHDQVISLTDASLAPHDITGSIAAVTPGVGNVLPTIAITVGTTTTSYAVADYATFADNSGAAITLADLQVGNLVTVTLERNTVARVAVTTPAS